MFLTHTNITGQRPGGILGRGSGAHWHAPHDQERPRGGAELEALPAPAAGACVAGHHLRRQGGVCVHVRAVAHVHACACVRRSEVIQKRGLANMYSLLELSLANTMKAISIAKVQ